MNMKRNSKECEVIHINFFFFGGFDWNLKIYVEIFGQASKNIDSYRASIASKDIEIGKLKMELEECQQREQSYKSTSETQQCKI